MKSFALLIALIFALTACQHQPTKVTNQEPVMTEAATAESLMKSEAVILDARAPFEFNLSHVPGAINVRWDDFSQQNAQSRGLLQTDSFALARRLSLIGIDPETRVIVLGKGPQGAGEEGRIAWTLKYLGIKSVFTLDHKLFRERNPTKDAPLVQNKSYWKPQIVENLTIPLVEFKSLIEKKSPDIVILDVRSPAEFALLSFSTIKGVKARVLNIPWQDFFADSGLPRKEMEPILAPQGLTKSSKIIVVSNHGVRSAAVTYALWEGGFNSVRNFSGGYEQWK